MKRFLLKLLVCCAVVAAYVLILALLLPVPEAGDDTWRYLPEESYLVDVIVHPESGTAEILYALCFDNPSDDAYNLAPVRATFARKDLSGWMKYEHLMDGVRQDGEYDTYLPPKTKTSVVFSFTGEYLGGEISSTIAPPDEIMYLYGLTE